VAAAFAATPKNKCKAAAKKRKRNKVKSHLRLVQVNVAHNSSESHILLCALRSRNNVKTLYTLTHTLSMYLRDFVCVRVWE